MRQRAFWKTVGAAILVVAVSGSPAWAAGRSGPAAAGLLGRAEVWIGELFAGWGLAPASGLAVASGDAGHDIDPNGLAADAGHDIDPNGISLTTTGTETTDAGHDIDPNG